MKTVSEEIKDSEEFLTSAILVRGSLRQMEDFKKKCKKDGVRRSEVIRTLIDKYIKGEV